MKFKNTTIEIVPNPSASASDAVSEPGSVIEIASSNRTGRSTRDLKAILLEKFADLKGKNNFISKEWKVSNNGLPVELTPEMLAFLLVNFRKNRPINWATVDRLRRDIVEHRYQENVTAIWFDRNGYVIESQHRMVAHCLEGVPLKALCIVGAPKEAILFIDRNRPRSTGLVSKMVESYNMTDWEMELTKESVGTRNAEYSIIKSWFRYGLNDPRATDLEMEEFRQKNLEIITKVLRKVPNQFANKSPYRAAVCMYYMKDPTKAEEFFNKVGSGVMCQEFSPEIKMREYLEGVTKHGSYGGTASKEVFWTTVYFIQKHFYGEKTKKIGRADDLGFLDPYNETAAMPV